MDVENEFPLEARDGLPDALRALLEQYPKEAWAADPNFSDLIRFWLERHVMFRRIVTTFIEDAQLALDGGMNTETYVPRLSRLGNLFINQLHGHHTIEDTHYFPRLISLEKDLANGFDILDNDHHDIDEYLSEFSARANALINAATDGRQLTDLAADVLSISERGQKLLHRHLTDEEELVVPILLKHAPDDLT